MSLLTTYVRRQFLHFFWIGIGGCAALFLVVELFDRMDEFIERHVLWYDAVRYLALKLPSMVYQTVPLAFLLASVLTFSTMSRSNEITAVRAGGMSPLRLTWPLFVLGGIGCLVLLMAQEYLLPYTNQAYNLVWRTRIRHEKMPTRSGMFKQGHIWYRAANRIWSIQLSKPLKNRLLGVTIYELDAADVIRRRYDAVEARWEPQGWMLLTGIVRVFGPEGTFSQPPETFTQRRVSFPERPADISAVRKRPEEMGLREVLAYARRLHMQGLPNADYVVDFHGKVAFAVVCVIMAGFGVPLALHLNRSGGTVKAIGLTLFCGLSYWMVHSMALALGQSGQLPPLVAAWGTNICFGAGNIYLAYRLQ